MCNFSKNIMITVQSTINATTERVWELWTLPEHIVKWNTPSQDWHTTKAENDLKIGGKFKFKMASKEKNISFDFEGIYTNVEKNRVIAYKLSDNRIGSVHFIEKEDKVTIAETFEPETGNPEEMQKEWCQAVIDSFKEYVENFKK